MFVINRFLILCLLFSYLPFQVGGSQQITTKLVIDQITDSVNTLIDEAEASSNFILKRAAQELLFMLDAFEKANQNLLTTAFDNISRERIGFVNSLRESLNELKREADLNMVRAEGIVDQVYQLGQDVAFKNYPVIFRYRGTIVVPGTTQMVRVTMEGANLKEGEPHLSFKGEKYPVRRIGSQSLLVEIPREIFVAEETEPNSEDGELVLLRRYGGFLGWFTKTEEVTYTINFVTLPNQLGSAKITYNLPASTTRSRDYNYEVAHNSSRRDWDCRGFAYSPSTTERRFNPDTAYVREGSGNSRGQIRDIQIKDTGISFHICAKRRVPDRDNGFRHALVFYTELWTETGMEARNEEQTLSWNNDTPFNPGTSAKVLAVEVTLFTGRSIVLTSSGPADNYVTVNFDIDNGYIIIKPQIPDDIKRL